MAGVAGRSGRKKKLVTGETRKLSDRLRTLMEQERLSVRDLAAFLHPIAAYETIFGWIHYKHEPPSEKRALVDNRLALLEWCVRQERRANRSFIPSGLKQYERGPHVKQALADALSAQRIARR